ncbi:MAG TPA: head GIN domain-containing protein [Caldilineaceae bacterium]|nr:head GIN domain-containing protein [Caldilineaceae bacterium]
MQTRPYIALSTLLLTLLLSACGLRVINGSGRIVTESRPVSDIHAVNFSGFGELTVTQGEDEGLTITTDDNLLPYIKTSSSGGVLTIGFEDGGWTPVIRPSDSIRFALTVNSLDSLDLSGAGTVKAERLTGDGLTLRQSGAGQISIGDLRASDLTVDMSGAGNIDLAGQVTNQTVELSGLGNYEAGNLESQSAAVTLSGAGNAPVWANEQLDAQLSGAGSIKYYGEPQVHSQVSGLGDITGLGAK